jgi:hypothetical protein
MVLETKIQPTLVTQTDYSKLTIPYLKTLCKDREIKGISKLNKEEIIQRKIFFQNNLIELLEKDTETYKNLTIPELKNLCKERGIKGYSTLNKENLIRRCLNLPINDENGKTTKVEINPTTIQASFTFSILKEETNSGKKRKTVPKDEVKVEKPKKKSKTEPKEPDLVQCYCRVPAARRLTKKEGANQGREFYTCKSNGCSFFSWVE